MQLNTVSLAALSMWCLSRLFQNNFKRDMIKQVERAEKWKCFVCDPKPLAVHVLHNSKLQVSVQKILPSNNKTTRKWNVFEQT